MSLPLTSFTSLVYSAKNSAYLQLRDSSDPLVSNHWNKPEDLLDFATDLSKANVEVQSAENFLYWRKLAGCGQIACHGLGFDRNYLPSKGSNTYRKTVNQVASDQSTADEYARAVQLDVQGQWTAWVEFVKNDFSWKTLLALQPFLV